jgi:ATP-dependent DNA helicase RecQ
LFNALRALRRELAEVRSVPPYVIFGDVALRHMARSYPTNEIDFAEIPGVGSQKLADFGAAFTAVVRKHLGVNPMQEFKSATAPATPASARSPAIRPAAAKPASMDPPRVTDTIAESLRLFRSGITDLGELARQRNLAESTIASHLANAIISGRADDLEPGQFLDPGNLPGLAEVFEAAGQLDSLGPVKELAGDRFAYRDLHFFRAFRKVGKV